MKTVIPLIIAIVVGIPHAFAGKLSRYAVNVGTYHSIESTSHCHPTVTLMMDETQNALSIQANATSNAPAMDSAIIIGRKISAPYFGIGERWWVYSLWNNKIVLEDKVRTLLIAKNYTDPVDVIEFTSPTQITVGPKYQACKYSK